MPTVLRYQYPGDPILDVTLLTGTDFRQMFPRRAMVVWSGDQMLEYLPVTDVVCDNCSAPIADDGFCALSLHSLYCRVCYDEWIAPYLLTQDVM